MQQSSSKKSPSATTVCIVATLALAVAIQSVAAVITVQIGGATRLTSLNRQRDRYSCYWDCDLVGCQIARDDDECAYDCEKICRVRYDYAAGRSGAAQQQAAAAAASELTQKSSATDAMAKLVGKSGATQEQRPVVGGSGESVADNEITPELMGAGTSVRLHLPRNASARNFAIWERCSADTNTGKLTEKPFNL